VYKPINVLVESDNAQQNWRRNCSQELQCLALLVFIHLYENYFIYKPNACFFCLWNIPRLVNVVNSFIFWNIMPCSPVKVNWGFSETYRVHLQGQRVSQARNHIKQAASRAGHVVGTGGTRTTGVMMFSCLVGTHTSSVSLLYSTYAEARDLPSLVLILYKVSFVKYR
jgi:hypothetical protein